MVRGGRTLVGPVTWRVAEGERWVIIGPNGAGKTTLIRVASAEQHPTSGVARVLGEKLGETDTRDLRASIGVSSSALAYRIPDSERVEDLVVSAGYAVVGRWRETYDKEDFDRATEILDQVGALHLAGRTWRTLSEGERKRVQLARALMTDPELLVLDEPTAGMDLGGREDLVNYLSDFSSNPSAPATVMITHHVEEIPEGFTHILLIDEGTVVAQGPIEGTLTAENLTATFHLPVVLDRIEGRYFARRARRGGNHRG